MIPDNGEWTNDILEGNPNTHKYEGFTINTRCFSGDWMVCVTRDDNSVLEATLGLLDGIEFLTEEDAIEAAKEATDEALYT